MGPEPANHAKSSHSSILPLAVLMAAVFFFNIKPLFLGFSFHDLTAFHHDFYAMGKNTLISVQEFYRTGQPPLWFSGHNMGSPMLGLYLPSIAHPLVLAIYRFDLGISIALLLFLNALLMALFAYLFFIRCGASGWGSATAAFLVCFSGFIPWAGIIYPVILPVPWMFCWLWSAMGIARSFRFGAFLWNTLAVLMILLCGDAQMSVQGNLIIFAWFVLWAWQSRLALQTFVRAFAALAAAALLGWLLASVQMLPATLLFSRVVNVRTPSLGEYAATFPKTWELFLSGLGLFSRQFRGLFLTFSAALLFGIAAFRCRSNRAFTATLILGAAFLIVVGFGRYGLAAIPFHIPLWKSFIRHYKLGVAMQAPLFLGVALGFDALAGVLAQGQKRVAYISLIIVALSLAVLPDNLWRAMVLGLAALIWISIKYFRAVAPFLLFSIIVADGGSQAWKAPYKMEIPLPDPIYLRTVGDEGWRYHVQGMYSWVARAVGTTDQPVPIHGSGYYNDHSIDSWVEYPIRTLAYFLAAISPDTARIHEGEFSQVDFSWPFKSTDYITPNNRHLVDLAAVRYFFLEEMGLSEADRFPILSDPEYFVNPTRPGAFKPWQRLSRPRRYCGDDTTACGLMRPALAADRPGRFLYEREFRKGDEIETGVAWDHQAGNAQDRAGPRPWAVLIHDGVSGPRLVFARALTPEAADMNVRAALTKGPGSLLFAFLDGEGGSIHWLDPIIRNSERTIRYREGGRVMVFENEQSLRRVRVVHSSRKIIGFDEALEVMRDPERYRPRIETILMTPDAPEMQGPEPLPQEGATLLSHHNYQVMARAELGKEGFLVLADTWYPGWRAFDEDGQELRIYWADMNMRAVKLGPGVHTVTYTYLPADFRIGLFATLASFFSMAVFGLGFILRSRLTP